MTDAALAAPLLEALAPRARPDGRLFDGLCRAGDRDTDFWFFQGGSVLRYSTSADTIVLAPAPITDHWPLLTNTPFAAGVDACYTSYHRPHGYHWLFTHNLAAQYNLATGALLKGPAPISSIFTFTAADTEFNQGVDAVCPPVPADGNYWFFRNDRMVAYDTKARRVAASGAPITHRWPGLTGTPFATRIDACYTIATGHHWLFTADLAAKYDSTTHTLLAAPTSLPQALPNLLPDLRLPPP